MASRGGCHGDALGAEAYASGDQIAFGRGNPDLARRNLAGSRARSEG